MSVIRQGDVIFIKVEKIPEGAELNTPSSGERHVIEHGSGAGNSHVINTANVDFYLHSGEQYLAVMQNSQVTHEEHDPVTLTTGIWKRGYQFEESWKENRKVID